MARRLRTFHVEWLGHHRDGQNAQLLGDLRNDRCCARTRATTHAGGDEQHVGTFDQLDDAIAIFHRCLTADFRIGACAETLGDVAADLQAQSSPWSA